MAYQPISGLFPTWLSCLMHLCQHGLLFLSSQDLEEECRCLEKRDPTPSPHSMLMVTLECVQCCSYPSQSVAVQSPENEDRVSV